MDNWLTAYLEAALSRCDARYIVLTDTNGIELSHSGHTNVNLQVLAAIFQDAVETMSKMPTGPCKSITTRLEDCVLLMRNFGSVYVVLVAGALTNLGKVYAVLDRMKIDLEPLVRGVDKAEESNRSGNLGTSSDAAYQGADLKKRTSKPTGAQARGPQA